MIREVRAGDAEDILAIYAPIIRDSHWSFETEVPSIPEFAKRIERIRATHPYLVMEQDERVIGYAYATRLRQRAAYCPSAETSIYMHPNVHGKGLGRKLYGTLLSVLELAGYSQFFAGATLPNDVSKTFHEAVGFKFAGSWPKVGYKFDQWWDVGWWHLERRERKDDPMLILSTKELKARPEYKVLLSAG